MDEPVIEARNLTVNIPIRKGLFSRVAAEKKILDGISFAIQPGEIWGCVGESGSGKSVLLQCLVGLLKPTSGDVLFEGKSIHQARNQELKRLRRSVSMIFQDPVGSLNRRMKVESIVAEPLEIHGVGDGVSRKKRVSEVMEYVGLNAAMANRYPHQFSGGQRQRIGIARALAINPKVILADEPVSALDVSLAAQVINLFLDLKDRFGLTFFIVAHNMAVLRQLCSKVSVIYAGRFVETGLCAEVYESPRHPYTRMLLESSPSIRKSLTNSQEMRVPRGESPDAARLPAGCPLHPRCDYALEICHWERSQPTTLSPTHQVECHLYKK